MLISSSFGSGTVPAMKYLTMTEAEGLFLIQKYSSDLAICLLLTLSNESTTHDTKCSCKQQFVFSFVNFGSIV